eukprot:709019-Amphidinium_carterae.1
MGQGGTKAPSAAAQILCRNCKEAEEASPLSDRSSLPATLSPLINMMTDHLQAGKGECERNGGRNS